ncbi:MAG: DVU0150 family protein [Syntrophobacteraceae bacterium]
MHKSWSKIIGLAALALFLTPQLAAAAGGGGTSIVIVADTRGLTGIMAWWASLYNESHLYFALLTVALIPSIGVVFGVVADLVMSHIGIDLKSRELSEH